MEKFNLRQTVLAAAVLAFTSVSAWAQMPSAPNSSMMKLFGGNTAFSTKIDVQVLDGTRAQILRMPMDFSALDGKMRVDTDLGQLKSKLMPPAAIAKFQQLGLDRITSLTRVDKKMIYIIYPRVQSMADMVMSKEDAEVTTENLKVEKTPLAKQTVDGHPCIKNHMVVRDPKGNVLVDATTWNASDMRDFPLQIETKEAGNTSVMHFQQVNFNRPDAKAFEPPAGYKQYSNPDQLMMAVAQRSSGAAAGAGKPAAQSTAKPAAKPAARTTVTNSVPRH